MRLTLQIVFKEQLIEHNQNQKHHFNDRNVFLVLSHGHDSFVKPIE